MDKKVLYIRVTGRVQGVGFRAFVKSVAEEMGISGWVKNLPDGSVQIFSVFPEELADRWISMVKIGPPRSQVDRLEIEDSFLDTEQDSREFIIV